MSLKLIRTLPVVALAGAVAAIVAPSAAAAPATAQEAASENWAGYVANASNAGSGFSSVSGSWTQPSANCSSGDGDSAFWVGLGGASGQSQSLEQIGTQANCSGGSTQQYAWYELVPAAPVQLGMTINPGDHISARVTVSGTNVTVSLSDQTTGGSATKTLQMSDPDTSTAEWIAEAPSECDGSGDCQPLPLTNFGSVTFSSATATAAGHTGPISDPNWTAQPVQLSSSAGGPGFVEAGGGSQQSTSADAQPSSLSSDGSSFSVSWQSDSGQSAGSGSGGSVGGDRRAHV